MRRWIPSPATRFVMAGVVAAGAIGAATMGAASAAVPTFPDNILVFPNRDFVTVEGYADHVGQTATIEVTRPGNGVIGSAQGVVSGGDVAFEVNHPGGVCWGNGTSLKVTPDIRPNDVATIKFGGVAADNTEVQDGYVTGVNYVDGATTFTIVGHIGPNVDRANVEQRTVNPDLVGTPVAKRDVRAVPGGFAPAPRGGYSSNLEFGTNDDFTATYVFDDPAVARTAATGGGERLLSWQLTDAAANRQGVTIAELGEPGGPGMGGCPPGPGDVGAPTGSYGVVRSADKASMTVDWTAATAQPGAAPVTGYDIELLSGPVDNQVSVGRRLGTAAARTTFTGLDAGTTYSVEVRSVAGTSLSAPFSLASAGPVDTTVPTLTATPAPGTEASPAPADSVTLNSNGQVYYTTDGSPVITTPSDVPADNAKLYAGPIAITAATHLTAAAFDQAGNHVSVEGFYAPPTAAPAPDAPTGLTPGTVDQGSVRLSWNPVAGATLYGVQAYDTSGVAVGSLRETTLTSLTVSGLTSSTTYDFTVKAKNASGYGAESAKARAATLSARDILAVTKVLWKSGDFRVIGTSTATGGTVTVYSSDPSVAGATAVPGMSNQPLTAAVPPATGTTFDVRLRTTPTPHPAQIWVKSSNGGIVGPVRVP